MSAAYIEWVRMESKPTALEELSRNEFHGREVVSKVGIFLLSLWVLVEKVPDRCRLVDFIAVDIEGWGAA